MPGGQLPLTEAPSGVTEPSRVRGAPIPWAVRCRLWKPEQGMEGICIGAAWHGVSRPGQGRREFMWGGVAVCLVLTLSLGE